MPHPTLPSRGSSPLTRGKPMESSSGTREVGLIPAHAGKTTRWQVVRCGERAHPRSRGENPKAGSPAARSPGSSPLTRGKRARSRVHGLRRRLIPAHAGKTRVNGYLIKQRGAHPRSRGENMQAAMQLTRDNGSSPLTRGKPAGNTAGRFCAGLIPAHAGKTRRPAQST